MIIGKKYTRLDKNFESLGEVTIDAKNKLYHEELAATGVIYSEIKETAPRVHVSGSTCVSCEG